MSMPQQGVKIERPSTPVGVAGGKRVSLGEEKTIYEWDPFKFA